MVKFAGSYRSNCDTKIAFAVESSVNSFSSLLVLLWNKRDSPLPSCARITSDT